MLRPGPRVESPEGAQQTSQGQRPGGATAALSARSPERASQGAHTPLCLALSGLGAGRPPQPQGVALGWFVAPPRGSGLAMSPDRVRSFNLGPSPALRYTR